MSELSDSDLLQRSRQQDSTPWVAPERRLPNSDLTILDGGLTIGGVHVPPVRRQEVSGGDAISSSASPQPFQIVPYGNNKVRVMASTLANDLPGGMSSDDDPPFLLSISGLAQIYGTVTFSIAGGVPGGAILRSISAGVMPMDSSTGGTFSVLIGWAVNDGTGIQCGNYRYGPIDANCDRNWYAVPPTFTVLWGS